MNVLVIDDHAIFRAGVVRQLEHVDPSIVVTECGTIAAGLQRMSDGLQPDLMLLDLHMPGYRDTQALQEVRQKRPDIPVLVISAQEDAGLVRRCVDLGAFGFLSKSAPAATLHPALKLVLAGGVFLPGSSLSVAHGDPGAFDTRPEGWEKLGTPLTERQRDVLLRIAQGKPNKVIAHELGLSDHTVKTHVTNIFNALGLSNRTQAVYALARAGISIHELRPAGAP